MLIPLDLYALVQRNRRLTPGLVLGWRAVGYIREYFCELETVRVAVSASGDLAAALDLTFTEARFPLDVLRVADDPAWHVLAYQATVGTLLEMTFSDERTSMDPVGRSMEDALRAGDPLAAAAYAAALDRQVLALMETPLEAICHIRERLVVPSRSLRGSGTMRCRRCGQEVDRADVWHADGIPCCAPCAGLPEAWIVRI